MNPRSRDEIKNSFSVSSKIICFKDKDKPAHWVGHSKFRSLDINDFFKITPKFDESQASVNGNTEEEKNAAKKTTDDAEKNTEENERIHKDKDKVVTTE